MRMQSHSSTCAAGGGKAAVTPTAPPTLTHAARLGFHSNSSSRLSPQQPQHTQHPHQHQQVAGCSSSLTAHSRSRLVCSAASLVNEVQTLAEINPVGLLLPVLGATVAGAAALRFYLYSQLEVITAKMLGKYVPSGGPTGARVIQLGGGTRELYYYPKDIVLVTNVGEKVNKGLMEQAGVTAAVPTLVRQQPITDLRFQPPGSIDAVIALNVLSELEPQQLQQCLQEVSRVLKPGMPLVFIEPLAEGGSPLRGLIGVSGGSKGGLSASQLEAWQQNPAFSYVQWDTALAGQDPRAVGVAVRSERAVSGRKDDDDDEPSARRRAKKQPKAAKGFS